MTASRIQRRGFRPKKDHVLLADLVKVIHHNNEHLLCLSSEEAALLLDLCHAGVISDHLSPARSSRKRLESLVGDLQGALHSAAQAFWHRQHPGAKSGPLR